MDYINKSKLNKKSKRYNKNKTKNSKTYNKNKTIKNVKKSNRKSMKGGDISFCEKNNQNPFNFINPNNKTNSEQLDIQTIRLFPFEECKKPVNFDKCKEVGFIEKRATKLDNILQSIEKLIPTNLTDLAKLIYSKMKQRETMDMSQIYGFFQESQIKDIFSGLNKSDISEITTWDEFKDSPDKSCKYDKFRKLSVDYLIIMIIIYLFGNENYTISKGTKQFFDSKEDYTDDKIKIVYEMVGSEDVTSDYDVSIYSVPPNALIPKINSIFSNAFTHGLGKSSSEIFDTNLYCHPFYVFTNDTNSYENSNNNDLFLKLSKNKYFLNSGHKEFHENEFLFSNLNYFDSNNNYDFQSFIGNKNNNVFEENTSIKNTIQTCNSTNCGNCDLSSCSISGNSNEAHPFCGIPNTTLNSKDCKEFIKENITTRGDVDSVSTEFLIDIYQSGLSNEINLNVIKSRYISPLRLSLWYADETYSTFSAYFHVIHCLAIPHANIEIIRLLLTTMRESFINMCRVSALDNFAFVFHYYSFEPKKFIKKVAKYIARISHACALLKLLKKPDNQSNLLSLLSNLSEFKNLGNHNDIIATYKNPNSIVKQSGFAIKEGLLSPDFIALLNNKQPNNMSIIKAIYLKLIDSSYNGYDINPEYLCIKLKT